MLGDTGCQETRVSGGMDMGCRETLGVRRRGVSGDTGVGRGGCWETWVSGDAGCRETQGGCTCMCHLVYYITVVP